MTRSIDVLVLRTGTEGLSMADYAEALRDRLPDRAVRFARTPSDERRLAADARVITGKTIDTAVLAAAERLELFACTFAGTDHVPVEELVERGSTVTNAAGVHVPGIAEQAIGYLLRFARRLDEAERRERRREWRHYQAGELAGSTVTVLGQGAIGRGVVERLTGFDVHTIGVRYTPSKGGPADEVIGLDPAAVHEALARTDHLVVATPLTEQTRGLIGKAEFGTMPSTAVLVNVARGPVVDTDALVWALRWEQLRAAALDVTDPEPLPPEHPLWTLENCLITPHVGGHNPRYWPRLADIVADNVRGLDDGGELRNVVARPSA